MRIKAYSLGNNKLSSSFAVHCRDLLVSPDLKVLLDSVVLLVFLDREASAVSLVSLAHL